MLVLKLLYCSLLVKCYQMKHYCKVLPDIITQNTTKILMKSMIFLQRSYHIHKVPSENSTGYCEKYVDVFPKRVIEQKSVLLDFCRLFWHEEEKDE